MDPIVTITLEAPTDSAAAHRFRVQTQFCYSQRNSPAAADALASLHKQLCSDMAPQLAVKHVVCTDGYIRVRKEW